ncbi:putative linoleate 9s-lipoxygenase 5 [Quercus suber]|uniref:Lipoxygenase n=1 Tax=Quercus suber TaxID=58331 RepID=A0AAW0LAC9_QUESU
MFHSKDLSLTPMKSLAGTSCGVNRPIYTVKSSIKGRDQTTTTSVTSRPLFFTMKWHGFSCSKSTGLTRSRSLSVTSTAEKKGQNPSRGVPVSKGAKSSHNILEIFNESKNSKVKGTVVLMKKNVLDFNDFHASFLDRLHEFLGQKVSLQLISAVNGDPEMFHSKDLSLTPMKSLAGTSCGVNRPIYTVKSSIKGRDQTTTTSVTSRPLFFTMKWHGFSCSKSTGLTRSRSLSVTSTAEKKGQTPSRGVPVSKGAKSSHNILEIFNESKNSKVKGTVVLMKKNVLDFNDFHASFLDRLHEFLGQKVSLQLISAVNGDPGAILIRNNHHSEFYLNSITLEDVPGQGAILIRNNHHSEFYLNSITLEDVPGQEDRSAWKTDEEFAREMLAGVNPVTICRLQEFPPTSKLDSKVYGHQTSAITKEHIEKYLNGLSIDEAIKSNKLFILDHHDTLMPYLSRINKTSTKIYASRTILFLNEDGTLKPLAIELSLPHPDGDQFGAMSKVYTPAEEGVQNFIWQLAKSYVVVNDSGYHQLMSHWLNTHAAIEPFVIATNRQLSVLHPIYKLLHPHFRDTMNVNALARQVLINANGALESTVFTRKYSMEMSSKVYKNWVFPEQALPADLIKRGIAVKDVNSPHGLRLLIEDYPYAVDGLEIWSAIKTWVENYCSFYYKTDDMVRDDSELQSWWNELREEGHGDKKDEPWWPKMQTREELIETCTTIIWIASALHAAINFGQYPYGGYPPNRPAMSRHFMPEEGTSDYEELKSHPEKALLKIFTSQFESVLGISLVEILSRHSSDEIFLGQRDSLDWTSDTEPIEAFKKFGKNLKEVEDRITKRNKDEKLKNRAGPVKMPYTLLCPTSEEGLTFKGIPNSVSI